MVFSGYSSFLHQFNWPPWYNWNIVESGVKHHKPHQCFIFLLKSLWSRGPAWPWSYGSWVYYYLCNQWLSPLTLWVRTPLTRATTLCDKVSQRLATGRWFSPGTPVSSTNKTDRHDITEILLKLALNTMKQTNKQTLSFYSNRNSLILHVKFCAKNFLKTIIIIQFVILFAIVFCFGSVVVRL